jgi:hypothetical protein
LKFKGGQHWRETEPEPTSIVPIHPTLASVKSAYYIEIPGLDRERFLLNQSASAAMRFDLGITQFRPCAMVTEARPGHER